MLQEMEQKGGILFKGPLNTADNSVMCNDLIYWSGEIGMKLVDKLEIEAKIDDTNRDQVNRYFTLFEEHISPKSNTLRVVVELK